MLDVTTGRYIERPAILIGDDGKIAQIATNGSLQVPAGVRRIDLPGETLLPGLIDMHVHLTTSRKSAAIRASNIPTASGRRPGRQCAEDARRRLHHGAQCRIEQLRRRRAQAGHRPGLVPGRGSSRRPTPSERPADIATTPASALLRQEGAAVVSGPEDGREKVRWMHKYGAEVIKICATGVCSRWATRRRQQPA